MEREAKDTAPVQNAELSKSKGTEYRLAAIQKLDMLRNATKSDAELQNRYPEKNHRPRTNWVN